jgi:hypothetical protein
MIPNKRVDLFIDSGAFSAWSQKLTIDVQDYIAFIKENLDIIDVYANLDVIKDAQGTWKNQRIMENAGLHPLPVYHVEDDIKYLHKCIDNYAYFCLGGMAKGYSTAERTGFLDRCFKIICDTPDHFPKCKVHGFGMTSLPLMLRYPWYSIDSTSWIMTGRMGSIFIPRFKDGKWIYDENTWKIVVSSRSPHSPRERVQEQEIHRDAEKGKHIDTFSPEIRKIFLNYIQEKGYRLGKSEFKLVEQTHEVAENERWVGSKPKDKTAKRELEVIIENGVSNRYELRDEINIQYFLDLENSLPEWPWAFERKEGKNVFFQ